MGMQVFHPAATAVRFSCTSQEEESLEKGHSVWLVIIIIIIIIIII